MEVKVTEKRDGVPFTFTVTGLPIHNTGFELDGEVSELNLTMNGSYKRTPNNSYCSLPPKDSPEDPKSKRGLAYMVLLTTQPPRAEFHVFKLSDCPAITESNLKSFNITSDLFKKISIDYPQKIANALDCDDLPDGVARFLLQAKKFSSN